MNENELIQGLITELRRGSLTLAVLGSLRRPHYGYALLQTLQELGIAIEGNTLYPLMRRLEGQGLLESSWDTAESRPRKYYRINETGERVFDALTLEWKRMQESFEAFVGKDAGNE